MSAPETGLPDGMAEAGHALQIRVIALCVMIAMIDGLDATSLAYVVPTISRDWHLAPGSFGLAFGMTYAGMLVGALAVGSLADRIGRKPAIILSMATFGALTLLTVFAQSIDQLLVLRFATGIGLGGALPNLTALISEFLPPQRRSIGVATMGTGIPIGSAIGGFATALLIAPYGWRAVFITAGGLALVCCAIAAALLPESPAFLRRETRPLHRPPLHQPGSLRPLFTGRLAVATLVLWLTLVLNYFDLHGLNAWSPTLLVRAGLSNANAASLSGLSSLFGTLGMILVGWLMDRFGAFRVIAGVFLFTALALLLIVLAPGSVVILTLALFAAVAGVDGANIGMFALAAALYDTPIRSTGVGWAIGIGRAGSIMGPIAGGSLLGVQFAGYSALFLTYAATALLAGLSVLLLQSAIAGRRREIIAEAD